MEDLIVVNEYYFQMWNKKEYNIIIIWVINSHIGPKYIIVYFFQMWNKKE